MKRIKRTLKATLIGAFIGACLTSIDGALLGAFFAKAAREGRTFEGALQWTYYFGVSGALGGALIAGIGAWVFDRMVLRPPGEDDQ